MMSVGIMEISAYPDGALLVQCLEKRFVVKVSIPIIISTFRCYIPLLLINVVYTELIVYHRIHIG